MHTDQGFSIAFTLVLMHGKLAFRGLFGYISIGIANMDPKVRHNGMNGARIIMALPGGDKEYSEKGWSRLD